MNIAEYLTLLASALAGGLLAFLWKEYRRDWLGLILAFAGSYMLGIIATHLLPGIFGPGGSGKAGLFLLAGFVMQLLFSNLSQGVEHGHFHKEKSHGRQFWLIYFGLCLHALVEGLPLSGYEVFDMHLHHHGHDHDHGPLFNHLLAGVALHKLPEAYVLALLMRVNDYRGMRFWGLLAAFAMMSPLGALLGGYWIIDAQALRFTMAFVVGSLLHIATTILFETESSGHHRIPWRKMAAIALGIVLALLVG